MQLYGRTWTKREIEARVGRMEQIGGVRRMQLTEGPEAGTEQIQVRTGAGLTYYVTPSRGMDISLAEFCDAPISWQSANGDAHPAYYQASGNEWLRTASGGLLMTCGLMQVGASCEDNGVPLGLHGRAHHTPARQVCAKGEWVGDEYELSVSGVVEETSIFGGYLRLIREIRSVLGENRIMIRDRVENAGFQTCPHMLLYHCNFGFPLMSENSRLHISGNTVVSQDKEVTTEDYDKWHAPIDDFQESVYYHSMDTPYGYAQIENPTFPIGPAMHTGLRVRLGWKTDTLPQLVQWKMPGAGTHVLGLEPANCLVEGRAAERERGTLVHLEPGECRQYELEFSMETFTE